MPSWVEKLAYLNDDVPSFLEVDFTILSIIVIYDCHLLRDINTNISRNTLLYLNRTYNWRTLA
jgi:hypothetical protein